MLVPLPLIYLTEWWLAVSGWSVYIADWPIKLTDWSLHEIYVLQLVTFAVLAALVQWWPLRIALVPRFIKRSRAHRHAVDQFLAQNLHTTKGRTGVLIFVSMAEHFAEVIADAGINDKVPHGTWEGVVARLIGHLKERDIVAGFDGAIIECGDLLAEHFPPGTADENELPNHLIVL